LRVATNANQGWSQSPGRTPAGTCGPDDQGFPRRQGDQRGRGFRRCLLSSARCAARRWRKGRAIHSKFHPHLGKTARGLADHRRDVPRRRAIWI